MQQQGIKPDTGVNTMKEIKAVFDDVSAKLGEGKKYLVGETMTAADIAFASLSAFALGQPFASYKGVPSGVAEQMKADIAMLKNTKAGKYALALWAEERATVLKAFGDAKADAPHAPEAAPTSTPSAPESTPSAPEAAPSAPEGTPAAPAGAATTSEATVAAPEGTTTPAPQVVEAAVDAVKTAAA